MTPWTRSLVCLPVLLLGGCHSTETADRTAALEAEVKSLRTELATVRTQTPQAAAHPELGQQMLELQVRHARLWLAVDQENWDFALFQTAELREAVAGIVETQPDHAALQPERLAEVMPAFMDPALTALGTALAERKPDAARAAFDGLSAACTACHVSASFTFLQVHRPGPKLLDNVGIAPGSAAPAP